LFVGGDDQEIPLAEVARTADRNAVRGRPFLHEEEQKALVKRALF